ncbi:MAG: type IV pilin protein [Lysobacteraceae bacterium]
MRHRTQHGFTLIEVMVVVAIIAILAAIAYPSYSDYAFRARRADGKEMMMRIASAQERYYTNLNRYADITQLGLGDPLVSEKGYYTVAITLANSNQTYTLTATPASSQVGDKCGNLIMTNSGNKSESGNQSNGKCW